MSIAFKRKSKKFIHRYLEKFVVNPNGSKYLSSRCNRKYLSYFRDRQIDQTYYLIIIKGNYIRAYSERYEDDSGKGINSYMGIFIPAFINGKAPESLPKYKKPLILKTKLNEYVRFSNEFRQMTPNLAWDD